MSVAVIAPPDQIRLHRAPPIDPPFDDELFPSLFQPHLHEAYFEPSPLLTSGTSQEGHTAALRFLNLCLELFNGHRSPTQMRPLLDLQRIFDLLDELADIARHLSHLRHRRPNIKVRRCQLRTCEPVPGVIEVAAVLCDGARTWAFCYRIERQKDEWRCTFLRALLPPEDPLSRPKRVTAAPAAHPTGSLPPRSSGRQQAGQPARAATRKPGTAQEDTTGTKRADAPGRKKQR